jgi:uncharacterized protein (TIGR02145 family)
LFFYSNIFAQGNQNCLLSHDVMKKFSIFYSMFFYGLLMILLCGCPLPSGIPIVATAPVTNITSTMVTCGGEVTYDGKKAVTERGVCYGTNQNPTIKDFKTSDGDGLGKFMSTVPGLTPSTIYYIRAYATNSIGTAYGAQEKATTLGILPTVTTTAVSAITFNTAVSGGNITKDGGSAILTRGICWSTNQTPTIDLITKTVDGAGSGIFNSNLAGLTSGTTYYVRAYATNSIGTSYGEQVSFMTVAGFPKVTTTSISGITITMAASGGYVTNDGGSGVISRGICWSTTTNPTIALSTKTTNGADIGPYSSAMTKLTANTTYYVKAYATNSMGTGYGDEVTFTTLATNTSDIDGNVYRVVEIGAQVWFADNLKTTKYNDGSAIPNVTLGTAIIGLTTGAYCWYNNDINNKNLYGALYNWFSANTGKLCPTGWHVPSDSEYSLLSTVAGGDPSAGNKLKEAGTAHWVSPNPATNETGFTALPGGYRFVDGNFIGFGTNAYFWSSTEANTQDAWSRILYNNNGVFLRFSTSNFKQSEYSIRCVKD